MRNLTVLLLILAVCAVAFSKGLRKRRSYTADDEAKLNALIRDIDDGKIDLNELLRDDDVSNPDRRLWIRWRRLWPFGKK